jgi:actin
VSVASLLLLLLLSYLLIVLPCALCRCAIDDRNELLGHIVLSGGSTLFPGFAERLRAELRRLINVAAQRHLSIMAPSNRKYLAWCGASVFAAVDTFPSLTMMNTEYFDEGALQDLLESKLLSV